MTTTKSRLTIYLTPDGALNLESLYDALRSIAPLTDRGKISRSKAIETLIGLALRDIEAHGRNSDVFKTMVTLPSERDDEAING